MNINGLVVNNKYCGVIDENGKIKILTKKNPNSKERFSNYLELDNIMQKCDDIIQEKENEILNNKCSAFVWLSILVLLCIVPLLTNIIFNISTVLLALLGGTSLIQEFKSFIKNYRLAKEIKTLRKEYREIKKEKDDIKRDMFILEPFDYYFEPKDEQNAIEESSKNLYRMLESFVKKADNQKIESYKILSFENDYIDNPTSLIYVPEIEQMSRFIENEKNKKNVSIKELLELRNFVLHTYNDENRYKCHQKPSWQKIKK